MSRITDTSPVPGRSPHCSTILVMEVSNHTMTGMYAFSIFGIEYCDSLHGMLLNLKSRLNLNLNWQMFTGKLEV